MQTLDLGKIKLTWKGQYDAGTEYEKDDVVGFSGSAYIHIGNAATTGTAPVVGGNATWDVFATGTDQLTTQGDILYHNGTEVVRLPAGQNGHTLTTRGSGANPEWALPSSRYGAAVKALPDNKESGAAQGGGVIMADDTLRTWGDSASGRLGAGDYLVDTSHPLIPAFERDAPTVARWIQNQFDNYCIMDDGSLYVWGINNYGQLGVGSTSIVYEPTIVPGLSGEIVIDVVTGPNYYGHKHALILTSSGKVFAMGRNNSGQLGDGTTVDKTVPTQITGTNWVKVYAAGANNAVSYAIDDTGDLYAWGYNASGELGVGDTTARSTPTLVNLPESCDKIATTHGDVTASGSSYLGHVVALLTDGTVFSWGYNGYGQLGDGTTTNKSGPTEITALGDDNADVFVSGSGQASSGVKKLDGTLRLWGYNGRGALGDGTTTNKTSPYVPSFTNVSGISKVLLSGEYSYQFMAVLFNDGGIEVAGYNGNRNLGVGDVTDRLSFTELRIQKHTPIDICPVGYSSAGGLGILTSEGLYYQTGANNSYQAGQFTGTHVSYPQTIVF